MRLSDWIFLDDDDSDIVEDLFQQGVASSNFGASNWSIQGCCCCWWYCSALCSSKLWGSSSPPYWPNQICSVRTKWTAIHHASLFCTCYYLIRAYIPRSIFMPPKTLGLTTQWQMICQTRALVICVTTINWRTTRQGLKKDRSFYIDLNRLTAKWTIVFWHW